MFYQIRIKSGASWGSWISLADLGASGLSRTLTVCAPDTFEFTVTGQDALTAPSAFAYNAEVSVRRQTTDSVVAATDQWYFRGRVRSVPRTASPGDESLRMTVEGPWSWFNTTVFRQSWPEYSGAALGSVSKPRAILFADAAGERLATGHQLQAICAAAVASGAPCAVQAMTGGITPPYDEQCNITCAQAAMRVLAYHPHAVLWFDYSTETPVLKYAQRSALPAVSVPFTGEAGFSVRERDDLKVPAVAIYYERQNSVDGTSRPQTILDKYPLAADETADSVLTAVYDLRGDNVQTVSQEVTAESWPVGWASSIAWWKSRVPWLRDYADADISLASGGRLNDSTLANIMTSGAKQTWMSVGIERERVAVTASLVARKSVGGVSTEVERITKRITLEIDVTGAPVGTTVYRSVSAWDSGEATPVGVAQALYTEWSQTHYEGSLTRSAEEPAGDITPGNRLNISGGLAGWASMGALVTRVTEQIDAGLTTIGFGPPGWTDVDARVLFERQARTRTPAVSMRLRSGSDTSSGISSPSAAAVVRDGESDQERQRLLLCNPFATPVHMIDLNANGIAKSADASTASVIAPREVLLPYVDAADSNKLKAKTAQVMASAPYGTAIELASAELATATPEAVAATGAVGTATKAAREDHVHAGVVLSTATPAAVAANGAVGTGTTAARSDHVHAGVTLATSAPPAISGSGAVGTAASAAREDHTHALSLTVPGPGPDTGAPEPDGGSTIMPAPSGFLGASASFSRRDHIHPVNVNDAVLPEDTADTADAGTSLRYSRADHVHKSTGATLETATPLADGTGAAGTSTKSAHGDHVHPLNVDATAPSAPAASAAGGSATKYARIDHVHPARAAQGSLTTMANSGTAAAQSGFGWVVSNAGSSPVKRWFHRYYYRSTAGAEAIIGVQHYEINDAVTGALVEVGPESEYVMHTPEAGA